MVDFGKFVEGLKGLIIQAEAEQTPPPVPPVVPAGPTPDPTQSGGATPAPVTQTVNVQQPAASPATPASTGEPAPVVATAAETIIPPAGVVDPTKTSGGTVYDRLDRGEKVDHAEINKDWDDPKSGLQARLMKAGR